MRTTGRRSFVLYILIAACLAGSIWLLISFFINGQTWATKPYNQHFAADALGSITDRAGSTLASTNEGVRTYSTDENMRKALLHTVGDTDGFITTGVQSALRAKLSGYNPITGAGNTIINRLGKNVELTISAPVSLEAYYALEGRRGAVLVYNYKTGDMVCKVSTPSFDPANMPEDLLTNTEGAYDGMLIDNTLSSSYVPGSTFKLITQAAAMGRWDDWASREYVCNGSVNIGGSDINCLGTHGAQTASMALGNSCNVYYALLANDLGVEALQTKAEEFGYNKNLMLGDITCKASRIDLTGADSVQLGWAGVGQYTTEANPYHIMTLMGAIADGGSYVEPRLTSSLDLFGSITSGSRKYMESGQAAALKGLMRSNVENYYGDGMFPGGMQVCAKSGTGEVGGDKLPTCWMVGFSSSSDSPYAFVIVVEEGNGGLDTAGAVASRVMNAVDQYVN